MGDGELKKASALRLVYAVSNPREQVLVSVNIQTPTGLRTYNVHVPVDQADSATYHHIRSVLGSALELGASVLDASLEREDSE